MAYRLALDAKQMEKFLDQARSVDECQRFFRLSATGPIVHAAENHPNFRESLVRGFRGDHDDVIAALDIVRESGGIERTAKLALTHAQAAINSAIVLTEPSPVRSAMINLVNHVITRPA